MPIVSGGGGGGGGTQGTEIGYDQATGAVSVASSTEATGTTLITASAYAFDGAAVIAEFYCPNLNLGSVVANVVAVSLFEGVTQIGRLLQAQSASAGTSLGFPVGGKLRFTPTAASHTYTVTAFATDVTGTKPAFNPGASGTGVRVPMFVRFTKV